MDVLVSQFKRRLTNISLDLVRECINEVAWDERISAIIRPPQYQILSMLLPIFNQSGDTFIPLA